MMILELKTKKNEMRERDNEIPVGTVILRVREVWSVELIFFLIFIKFFFPFFIPVEYTFKNKKIGCY
jgi:hypothetical protein